MNPLMQSIGFGQPKINDNILNIIKMLKSGNPQQIAQNLIMQNPQFKSFIEQNKGKNPEQVAHEYGFDLNGFLKQI